MTSTWLTASELAGLPGMPGSEFRTRAKLDKLGIPSRLRMGRSGGGGREFDAAHLPAETRAALLLQQIEATPAPQAQPTPTTTTAAVATATTGALATTTSSTRPPSRSQAACADARATLLRALATMTPLCGGITKAAQQLSHQLTTGVAAPELLATARIAHQRARLADGLGVSIGVRTLFTWHTLNQVSGWAGLLPEATAPQPVVRMADDVAAVLKRYASTSGAARNLTHCAQAVNLELGNAYDDWRTLYDRARRAMPKLDKVKLIKARHTGAERAAKLPFKRRDSSMFEPMDIAVCDGHTFKAKVRHPDHGQPFAPEVTAVMDVVSRKVIGWSVSLSESTIAVGAAVRHAVAQHGVPALMYTDNGGGEKAKYFDCPVTGLFERLGCEHRTGLPRHPQGHGVIERAWKTHMIKAARKFATYQGKDVDDCKLLDVSRELAREQRAIKRAETSGEVVRLSAKCPSWQQFIDEIGAAFDEYNSLHRHRGLPKHTEGPHAGKHMTSDEAHIALQGNVDVPRLDEPTLRSVFMPAKLCSAIRGEVRFLNQAYYSPELMQVDGEKVSVQYDIHDPAKVWVWSVDGQYICEAVWNANRIEYFPKAVVEMAREKRVRAAIKRREAQIDTAKRELQPTISAPTAAPMDFIGDALRPQQELQMVERVDEPLPAADSRPFFDSASDRYEWLMRHRTEWADADAAWLRTYAASPDYQALHDYYAGRGIAQPEQDEPPAFNQAG